MAWGARHILGPNSIISLLNTLFEGGGRMEPEDGGGRRTPGSVDLGITIF